MLAACDLIGYATCCCVRRLIVAYAAMLPALSAS